MKYIKYLGLLFCFCIANNSIINASDNRKLLPNASANLALAATGVDLLSGSDGSIVRALVGTAALVTAVNLDDDKPGIFTMGVSLAILGNHVRRLYEPARNNQTDNRQ